MCIIPSHPCQGADRNPRYTAAEAVGMRVSEAEPPRKRGGPHFSDDLVQCHAQTILPGKVLVKQLGNNFHFPVESTTLLTMSDDLADRIKRWRTENHLTQAAAAKIIGIADSYISKLERGVQDPAFSVKTRILSAIGQPAADTVAETRPSYGLRDEEGHVISAAEAALIADVVGPCRAGDVLFVGPAKEITAGDLVLLVQSRGFALARPHPITGDLYLWPLDGGSQLRAEPSAVAGVATALLRANLRSGPPAPATEPQGQA